MEVLVIGSSGRLGREVVDALAERGHAVRAADRRPEARTVSELSGLHERAAGWRRLPGPLPLPPRLGRALRAGGLTTRTADLIGATTFAE